MDGQVTNESQWNADWNPIWEFAVGRFDSGWTVEAAIPFKSLRYTSGGPQTWGFNIVRTSRSLNEISFLTEMPPARGARVSMQSPLCPYRVGPAIQLDGFSQLHRERCRRH